MILYKGKDVREICSRYNLSYSTVESFADSIDEWNYSYIDMAKRMVRYNILPIDEDYRLVIEVEI